MSGVATNEYICNLKNQLNNGTIDDLFKCYKDQAKLILSKEMCNVAYPYKNSSANMTSDQSKLQTLNERYSCYQKHLGINKDREYCQNSTHNVFAFYDCLGKHKIDKKADYC